jgi:hypothetical protein
VHECLDGGDLVGGQKLRADFLNAGFPADAFRRRTVIAGQTEQLALIRSSAHLSGQTAGAQISARLIIAVAGCGRWRQRCLIG